MSGKYEHQTTSVLLAFFLELGRQIYISKQGIGAGYIAHLVQDAGTPAVYH